MDCVSNLDYMQIVALTKTFSSKNSGNCHHLIFLTGVTHNNKLFWAIGKFQLSRYNPCIYLFNYYTYESYQESRTALVDYFSASRNSKSDPIMCNRQRDLLSTRNVRLNYYIFRQCCAVPNYLGSYNFTSSASHIFRDVLRLFNLFMSINKDLKEEYHERCLILWKL